jgi:tRNA threonylcarbamoyladenosine biosynthesis protein TsaB
MIHDQNNILLEDGYRDLKDLQTNEIYRSAKTIFIDDRSFLVSPKYVIEKSVLVENIHDLVPNYLRKTEAESKHDQKSDT